MYTSRLHYMVEINNTNYMSLKWKQKKKDKRRKKYSYTHNMLLTKSKYLLYLKHED